MTCGLVWKKVYESLREPITDAEWALILYDPTRKATIETAMRERLEESPDADPRPLRIDYLGEMTIFKGLKRDAEHAEAVLLPGKDNCETWAIRLGARR